MTQYNDAYLGQANRYGGNTPISVILADEDALEIFRRYVPGFNANSLPAKYRGLQIGPVLQDTPIFRILFGLTREQLDDLRHEFWSLSPKEGD